MNVDASSFSAAPRSEVGSQNDTTTAVDGPRAYQPTAADFEAKRSELNRKQQFELFQPIRSPEQDENSSQQGTSDPNQYDGQLSSSDWEQRNNQIQNQIDQAIESQDTPWGFETRKGQCGTWPGPVYFAGLSMDVDFPVFGNLQFTQWLGVSPGAPCLFVGQNAEGEFHFDVAEAYDLSREHVSNVIAAADYSAEVMDQ